MFKLVIQDDEGKTTIVPLIRDEITIGRKEGNTIRLTERNVSRRHARILRNNGEVHIEDLGSYNGIRVNNARIAERVSLRVSDQVQIGDYKLYLKAEGAEQTDEQRTVPLERVDSQVPTESMPAVAPGALPHGMPQLPAGAQLIGNPNRTLVAIADTDPTGRTIGPATAEAVAALTAAPTGHGKLVVLSSNFAGKEFELSRPQMIIGRTDENDIVVNHRSISRNHAKLVREPETGRYTISDLQSSNGVRVNGQDYGKVELRRGDVIDLGHVRLRFIEAGEDFVFARDAVITDVPEAGGRRGVLVAVLAAIVAVVAGVVVYAMHTTDSPAEVAPPPETSHGVIAVPDATEAVAVVDPPGPDVVPDSAQAAVPPGTAPPSRPGADEKAVFARCTELYVKKQWQALEDCSIELSALGMTEKAKEFHDQAVQETSNDINADKVRQELRVGNLREAQATLRAIGEDSVYAKPTREAFNKAETQAVDDARRRAQGYVNAHDCQSLKRLYTQLAAASTERVAAAVGGFKCTAAPEATPKAPPSTGSAAVAQQPPPTPPVAAQPKANPCDAMNVEDVMSQASTQYSAGYAKAALQLVLKALACKQDPRMYRFAVTYACSAKDLQTAKLYFTRVPPANQANLEQKCQLEGLNVRGP